MSKHVAVGNLIKHYRLRAAISRTELAGMMKLKNAGQVIYNMEVGKNSPRFIKASTLDILGIDKLAFRIAIMKDFEAEADEIMRHIWSL